MIDEYIEKKTPKGILLRINSKKNTYMIFKNNESLKNPRSKTQSIVHELPQVIFLGKEFEIKMSASDRIGFFDVVGGQIYIPFWLKSMSDIRHIKLPAFVDSDLLPVYVYHFQSFQVGSIPVFASGINYFVVEAQIDREMLIRLKMNFPTSRVIIYRGEKDTFYDTNFAINEDAAKVNVTRATDLVEADDSSYLSQNPSFAARIYLRRMHLEKVYEIPELFLLKKTDIEIILGYLRIMQKKGNQNNEIRQNIDEIEALIELFIALDSIFSYNDTEVENMFKDKTFKQSLLLRLRKIVKNQMEINKTAYNEKKLKFFAEVMLLIDPLISE